MHLLPKRLVLAKRYLALSDDVVRDLYVSLVVCLLCTPQSIGVKATKSSLCVADML